MLLSHCEPRPLGDKPSILADALLKSMKGPLRSYSSMRVVEVGVGRKFTYVVTEQGQVGIAFSWLDEPLPSWVLEDDIRLVDLVAYAWQHPTLTSMALAASNAAMQALLDDDRGVVCFDCDFVEELGLRKDDVAAIVGYVPGIASAIAGRVRGVVLFEDNPMHRREAEKEGFTVQPGNQLLTPSKRFTVIVATGASLIDPRVFIAKQIIRPRLFALVGPTSSFHPEAARHLGVSVYGGSYIPQANRLKVLKLVKAGYGFRALRRLVEKWVAKALPA